MADISSIKLPNNSSYNLKDASALFNLSFSGHAITQQKRSGISTTIDLGSFDALEVTDLNAGNLVVTGSGRFTNGIYGDLVGNVTGNLTGNASTATTATSATTATTATKLSTTTAGSLLNPVYFSGGVPVASAGNTIPYVIGTGSTAGTWLGTLTGVTSYYDGLVILYKIPIGGASTTTLNLNSLGAKTIYVNHTTKLTTHFPINQPILLVYSSSQNSGCWMCLDDYWTNSDHYTTAWSSTGGDVAAKVASCSSFKLSNGKTHLAVLLTNDNTASSALTLNINGTGAKPIYINGSASSSSNKTLPAGSYLVYYDGTNYYFRTDGKITGSITGTASLATSGVTAGSYGPTDAVNGANGATMNVPYITVDAYGRVTSIENKVYTSVDTHYTTHFYVGAEDATSNTAVSNPYLTVLDNSTSRGSIRLQAGSNVAIASTVSNNKGTITISSTDTNTTYAFAGGTNKFTVTPSSGDAYDVTITPSIANNITGSGTRTSGYLAKFSGTNTITNGPQLVTTTANKFLRDDGTWVVPQNTWIQFVGATETSDGIDGYLPAPGSSNRLKFLRGDGTWQTPIDVLGTLPIAQGGTGATSAENARTNLEVLRYINTNDMTTWTAQALSETNSIAFTRGNVTGAYTTGHMVWLNARTIGTPFQLVVHDSSDLYLYKRWYSSNTWSSWTKMNAGKSDSSYEIIPNLLTNEDLNDYHVTGKVRYYYASGGNNVSNNPANSSVTPESNAGLQFGMVTYATAGGHVTQELACNGTKWIRFYSSSGWGNWQKFITSGNYTDYTVTKTGGGASGSWGISITGSAATAGNVTGVVAIANGGTGKTTALNGITALGGPYLLAQGNPIAQNSNLDTDYNTMGTYYSGDSTVTGTLTGTVPMSGSGFKLITAVGYRAATLRQFLAGANELLYYRSSQDTGTTWSKWYQIVRYPSQSDRKTFAALGNDTRPIYISTSGIIYEHPSYRMAVTNLTTTTAVSIDDNLVSGIWYVNGTSSLYNQSDGAAYVLKYDNDYIAEIYQDFRTGQIALRGKNNTIWQNWRKVIDHLNYGTLLAGGTISGEMTFQGNISTTNDLVLGTPDTSSNDSGDIIWFYGNGNEKARLWQPDSITAKIGPSYKMYNSDGTQLFTGTLPLSDGTGASGTWNIDVTGTSTYSATTADTTNTLYLVGVTSDATTTLKRDTSVTMEGGVITATNFVGALTGHASLDLPLTGGTLTGNLTVQKTGENAYIIAKSNDTSVSAYLHSDTGGTHGVYSNGYWNGTTFTSSGKRLVYRDTAGNVYCDGHANLDLPLTGGTLTGNLTVQKAGETQVKVINTSSGNLTCILDASTENHGIWSTGYYNNSTSTFTSDAKWMIYRNYEGNIIVNGHATSDLALSGGIMTGDINMSGSNINLKTPSGSSDDCGDIVFYYGNGQEKSRIWVANTYSAKSGPYYRVYNSSGTSLYSGTLPLADGTGASGTWNIHASSDLALTGGTITGSITYKTAYNAAAANNGLSSGVGYPTTVNILDSSDRIMVRLEGVIDSNGQIGSSWYVRNYNTSGGQVAQKGIWMRMDKAGTLTYTVSDAANFRSAIGAAATSHGNHVPATQTASNKVFLRNDNTWQTVTPGNIGALATTGGTLTGSLTIKPTATTSNAGLELWGTAPFIDFHYNYSSTHTDYCPRLYAVSEQQLRVTTQHTSGPQFGVVASTNNYTLLTSTAIDMRRTTGESVIRAASHPTSDTSCQLYMTSNVNGVRGIYGTRLDGTGHWMMRFANNSSEGDFYGRAYRQNVNTSWINALLGTAGVYLYDNGTTGFNAIATAKCPNGAWTIGALNSDSNFYIAYGNNTRLTNQTNGSEGSFKFDTSMRLTCGKAVLTSTQDAQGTSDNSPALVIGTQTGAHLEFDPDEIMAKGSGTSTAGLYLNWNGGMVSVGAGGFKATGPIQCTYHSGTNKQFFAGDTGSADEAGYYAQNSLRKGQLTVTGVSNLGIYDSTNSNWMIVSNSSQVVNVPHPLTTTSAAGSTGRRVIITNTTANTMIDEIYGTSGNAIGVKCQWGGSSWASKSVTTSSSDVRLKTNISDTKINGLELVNKIRVRQFDWIDKEYSNGEGFQKIGFVADELEELDDKLAIGGGYLEDGTMNVKSVDTFYLIGYLTKAIQELSDENKELKSRIDRLENK